MLDQGGGLTPPPPPAASRLHLLWLVPVLAIGGLLAFAIGLFGWCGDDALGCTGDAMSTVGSIGPGILVILIAATLMWLVVRAAPWSASALRRRRTAIAVGAGYLALVLAYVLITGLWSR